MDSPLFQVVLKRRIRALVCSGGVCPCRVQVLDERGGHAITCMCGGAPHYASECSEEIGLAELKTTSSKPKKNIAVLAISKIL